MVFSSAIFLFGFFPLFLVAAVATNYLGVWARNLNIVIFSLSFYVFGSGIYTVILLGSVLFNFYAAQYIARKKSNLLLILAVIANLLPLLFFKYVDFIFSLTEAIFFKPFLSLDIPLLNLFLPVGISFYTFQAIAYLIDVHRKEHEPDRNLTSFATYLMMFPQLVAGPIVRFSEIRLNLAETRLSFVGLNAGLFFFGVGLAKKMLIADPIGFHVDNIYALSPDQVTSFMAWFAAIGYFLQIFFDFSGYSDMAIGIGLMVGFSFPENFRQPYRAHSITDFWRRWHLTLSRWFRDYLYIPLGGNRGGMTRTVGNLAIVFVICGLWHGAAITFLLWGVFHGLCLGIERILKRVYNFELSGLIGVAVTTALVIFGWVLFRSTDLAQAQSMMSKMLFLDTNGQSVFGWEFYLTPYIVFTFLVGLFFAWIPSETWRVREKLSSGSAVRAGFLGLGLIALSITVLSARGFNPFIYFQF